MRRLLEPTKHQDGLTIPDLISPQRRRVLLAIGLVALQLIVMAGVPRFLPPRVILKNIPSSGEFV